MKDRRDAAILELHKEGKSFREIDKALGLGNDTARKFIAANEPPKNAGVTNFGTPSVLPLATIVGGSKNGLVPKLDPHWGLKNRIPVNVPPPVLPLANTTDRSDTRVDVEASPSDSPSADALVDGLMRGTSIP